MTPVPLVLLSAEGLRNEGHGHVYVRPDGARMRCGGARGCSACADDLVRLNATRGLDSTSPAPLGLARDTIADSDGDDGA